MRRSRSKFDRLGGVWRARLVHNALALYGAQFANYLVPLVMIPYLARVLGPSTFGAVALAQAIGWYVILIVEFGFNMSATRDVARQRDSRSRLGELLGSVTSAKLVLAAGCLVVLALTRALVPWLHGSGWYLWAGALWGVAAGLRPLWLFLGLEDVRTVTLVDVAVKLAAALATVALVRSPHDGLLVLILQGAGALVSTGIATALAYRRAPFRLAGLAAARDALRLGRSLFIYRVAISLYTSSNIFLLGFVAPVQAVGYYAGAEKIYKALIGLFDPLSQAIYPAASRIVLRDTAEAARQARAGMLLAGGVGLLGTGATFVLAPLVVPAFLGAAYRPAIPMLQILSCLLPVLGVSIAFAVQWLFPLGCEALVTRVSLAAGALHIALALALGTRFGGTGVACALVITESLVLAGLFVCASRARLNPFTAGRRHPIRLIHEEAHEAI